MLRYLGCQNLASRPRGIWLALIYKAVQQLVAVYPWTRYWPTRIHTLEPFVTINSRLSELIAPYLYSNYSPQDCIIIKWNNLPRTCARCTAQTVPSWLGLGCHWAARAPQTLVSYSSKMSAKYHRYPDPEQGFSNMDSDWLAASQSLVSLENPC